MRKFLIIFLVCLFVILSIISFIITLYIPETFNRKPLTLRERITCIFNPDKIQKASIDAYVVKRKSAVIVEQNENNLKLLDGDAHQYAMTEYCKKSGGNLDIDEDSGLISCDFTQESCEKQNNLVTTTAEDGSTVYDMKSKYFEWHNGKCVKTYPLAKGICDFKYNFVYDKGNIVCDEKTSEKPFGKCNALRNPTCYISSDYCRNMGLEHESAGGFGDCYNPLWQDILENLLGATLVRKYKAVINNLINNCKNDPFSSDCAEAAAIALYPQYTLGVIAKDTAFKFFPERFNELIGACGSIDGTSSEDIINCALAYVKFDPVTYMGITLIKVLGKVICEQLASVDTSGLTGGACDITGKVIKGLLFLGDKALEYLIKFPQFGKVIVEGFSQLGDILADGFDDLKDGLVTMFDGLADIVESINFLGAVSPVSIAANAILLGGADVAIKFVEFFDQDKITDIVTYGATIVDAFEKGGEELGKFVTSQVLEGGLDALQDAGQLYVTAYGEAAELFSTGLSTTARELENAAQAAAEAAAQAAAEAKEAAEKAARAVEAAAREAARVAEEAANTIRNALSNAFKGFGGLF
jgi:hypothetical protein